VTVARETLDRLDATRPVAAIWLVRGSDAPAGWCAAAAFKDRASALDALQKTGTGGAQREGTIERRLPSGDVVWGAVKDRQLLLSSSHETLLAAGALAITTQGTPMSGQALVTLSPSVLARGTGQPLDVFVSSVLSEAVAEMDKDASGAGKRLTPASKNMTGALLKALVRPLSEIAVARISFEIGDRRGVALRVEAQPTAGSGLAAKTAHVSPYAFDPALPVHSDASAVIGWGDMAPWLADWIQVVEASGPAGSAAGRDLRALVVESMEGGSCAADVGAVPIRLMCSLSVRPGVDASHALAGYLAFLESSNAWEAEIDGRRPTPLKVKHKGKVVEIEKAIERNDPQATALMKTIMGGGAMHTALTVKDRHVVLAVGPKPREILDRYGKPHESMKVAAPILARSLVDTAGADFMGLLDVVSVLGKVLANSKESGGSTFGGMMAAVPGLSDLRAPVVLDGHGGSVAAMEIQVPFGSLQNIARVVSAFMGQMGATPAR
jgi:hypothetical protein